MKRTTGQVHYLVGGTKNNENQNERESWPESATAAAPLPLEWVDVMRQLDTTWREMAMISKP
jgi:hypothetical protein